ncbi:MAG: hypothetical protein MJ214_03430 [Bacilli bacterium]|nr:hypothetical protein [Bacilli bacterium]
MNKILFANYLKKYLFLVSNKKTTSISYLFNASKNNTRIIDPLILYCVFNNKTNLLNKHTDKYINLYNKIKDANYHFEGFKDFDFVKIYDSFLHESNRINYDNDTKLKMRDNILNIKKDKKISNYRIYTDLKLNPGNVNSFIKNKDVSKISLDTTKRIVNYLYNY